MRIVLQRVSKCSVIVDDEIIGLRSQLYKILEEERANTPAPDVSFLSDDGWG